MARQLMARLVPPRVLMVPSCGGLVVVCSGGAVRTVAVTSHAVLVIGLLRKGHAQRPNRWTRGANCPKRMMLHGDPQTSAVAAASISV
jgi:hypothetical protein